MSFLAPLIPAAVSLGAGLLSGAGKSSPQVNYTPPGFDAGGLKATFGGNGYSITPSSDRSAAVGNIATTFGNQANAYGNIATQWQPGFSNLRTAQLNNINANRTAAVGNLQQNLQNRRVLGSSFAQDAINRTTQQYDQQQRDTIAQTYLQELQASQQTIQAQYGAAVQSFQTGLNEMNLEASLASDLTGKASSSMANVAEAQAKLDAASAAGTGSFFGSVASKLGSGLSSMASNSNFGYSFAGI
jgi:hypothetical protein